MRARGCVGACARVWVRVWAPRSYAEPGEPCPVDVDRMRLRAQAFFGSHRFNANIGAWNTAQVTDLSRVCAACRPGGALPRASRTRSAGTCERLCAPTMLPATSCARVWLPVHKGICRWAHTHTWD
jgi:hypothetical protein